MPTQDRLIGTSRLVVRAAIIINRLFLAAVIAGLALSWLFQSQAHDYLTQASPGVDAPAELNGLRAELLLGAAMALATGCLLGALAKMIASVRSKDPFNAANAIRLRTIGWSLLALQLLDFPAMLITKLFPSLGSAAPGGGLSAGGWVAVLMVFVLARVFAAGAAMRDELEATI